MTDKTKVQGEGNYDAAREYDAAVTEHAKDEALVRKQAEEARKAIEGQEAESLDEAEKEGRSHAKH